MCFIKNFASVTIPPPVYTIVELQWRRRHTFFRVYIAKTFLIGPEEKQRGHGKINNREYDVCIRVRNLNSFKLTIIRILNKLR